MPRLDDLNNIAQSLTNVLEVVTNTPVQSVPVHIVNNTIHYLDALLNITMKEIDNEKASTKAESPIEVKASSGRAGKRKSVVSRKGSFGAGV